LIAALEKKYKTTVALVKKSTFGGGSTFATPAPTPANVPTTPAFGSGSFTTPGAGTSPAFGGSGFGGSHPTPTGAGPDYKTLLVNFYQKHNPSKLNTVDSVLVKYKGKETKLFDQLTRKYNTANPLGIPTEATAPSSGFGTGTGFGSSAGADAFGQTGTGKTPFGGSSFGGQQSSPGFGASPPPSSTPFGGTAQTSPFSGDGTGTIAFGGQQNTGFGVTTTSSPFGGGTSSTFGGTGFNAPQQQPQDHRARLIDFYQKHNPSKLNTVDATLARYRGREAQLFDSLEKKYLQRRGAGDFGQSGGNQQPAQSPFGSTGFGGTSSSFGSGGTSTGFGSGNTGFGGHAVAGSSPFGSNTGSPQTPGFGNTGFGSASPSTPFGGGGGGGGGFGSTGFGASTGGSSFGQTNFSGNSFSQMRK